MNIIILGPSGSGKGTQAKLLSDKLDLNYISMGDILREAAKVRSDIDRWINKKGELVPDEITFKVLRGYLEEENIFDNILFDGYPRSVEQYNLLKSWLGEKGSRLNFAFLLQISDREAVRRLSARRIDEETGAIYNLITEPPSRDVEIARLTQRDDDRPEAIKKRLKWYKDTTGPLTKMLRDEGVLIEVDGERPVKVIFKEIMKKIKAKNGEG